MKILIIHEYFLTPHSQVGSGSRWNQMAKYWAAAGHDVTVLAAMNDMSGFKAPAYKGKFIVKEDDPSGATVYRCHVSESYNKSFIGRLWAYFSFVFSGLVAGLFKTGRQDIIVCSSPPLFTGIIGVILSKFKRCPHVFELRDLWPESAIDTGVLKSKWMIKCSYWLEKWIYKNSKHLVPLTPAFITKLEEKKNISPDRMTMIPNACDFDLLPEEDCRAEYREKLGYADSDIVVAYIGAHGLANHLEQLIEAAEILKDTNPEIKILTVGSGMRQDPLREMVKEKGLPNVQIHSAVPKDEIFYFIQAADICTAVLKKVDTFKTVYPNKMFDYMSLKKPIVIGIDGAARKVVEESGSGLFAEPENAQAIVDAVLKLATSPELRSQMGESGYEYVKKNFDRKKLAVSYENVLLKCKGLPTKEVEA